MRTEPLAGPLLSIENLGIELRTDRGSLDLVDDLSLCVYPGETLGIVGESGCGKSITALSILRLIEPPLSVARGRILFRGEDLLACSRARMREIRGNAVSMIFQEPMTSLDPLFTIESQLTEALTFHRSPGRAEARAAVTDILRRVGIARTEGVLASYPHQLSGGMLQRVMIAMAMLCDPALLIADEPTTALDVTIQAQILALMNELQESRGTSILLITHDLGVVAETCRRVAVLYRGQIVEQGDVERIFRNPLHPYTRGLLRSVRSLGNAERRLYAIRGTVPSGPLETGCRFRSRCDEAEDPCKAPQVLQDRGDGHLCRCCRTREAL
ncbi:MAG: ABC transporter ATP-binding protein [Fretibacterium sp.]|uniref:ABC transporter ATP-binding protein n=1 Tax=Fretibacterium sp. OH1220_COT-178 TaxID=2491047 RepID=UPI000F5FAB29|nr:ABC transporter ATP-binding protein [Fretibacterium sp. OH1220_COT-178]MDO4785887.1 ABC transporter ATP-binding protein [Fretibacterium sp.]RRD63272.1 ABC transporter ATP-binding protein [Fretibacterium sp. OH1220_COT-178]